MAGDVMACLTCSFLIFIYSVIKAGASWHCILATYDFNLSLELVTWPCDTVMIYVGMHVLSMLYHCCCA